jgi:hypothetical protein
MVVDVVGDSIYVQAVLPDGTVFDAFSIVKNTPTEVEATDLRAVPTPEGVRLSWRSSSGSAFNVYRGPDPSTADQRLNSEGPITGGPEFSYLDRSVDAGRVYYYRLSQLDTAGQERTLAVVEAVTTGAPRFAVKEPRPNPFDRETELSFTIPRSSTVRISITDVAGRKVRALAAREFPAGPNALRWDGTNDRGLPAASGIYFADIRYGGRVLRTRLTLLR